MKILSFLTGVLLLASACARGENAVGIGERAIVPDRQRNWRGAADHHLLTRIWYPGVGSSPVEPRLIGGIFLGRPVLIGAPLESGPARYPLLLLSHGTGGGADSLDWLAAALAAQGYIVAGVNHPGNNALAPLTWDGFTLWWERAADLTDVLDALLRDPIFGPHIDPSRIGAIGFSLGGYTVLSLAGARTDREAFLSFCASPSRDAGCQPPEMEKSEQPAVGAEAGRSLATSGQSFKDSRVKAVFALAPALGSAFHAESFDDVTASVALLGGDQDRVVPPASNIRRYASFLPKAEVTTLEGAGHYSLLDNCVSDVADHVPLLCAELPGVDREAIHRRVIDLARNFFAAKTLGVMRRQFSLWRPSCDFLPHPPRSRSAPSPTLWARDITSQPPVDARIWSILVRSAVSSPSILPPLPCSIEL